jgi:hypothetical protein
MEQIEQQVYHSMTMGSSYLITSKQADFCKPADAL